MSIESAKQALASARAQNFSLSKTVVATLKAFFMGHKVLPLESQTVSYFRQGSEGRIGFEGLKNRQVSTDDSIQSTYVKGDESANETAGLSEGVRYTVNPDNPHGADQVKLGNLPVTENENENESEGDDYHRAEFDASLPFLDLIVKMAAKEDRDSLSDDMIAQTFGSYAIDKQMTRAQVAKALDQMETTGRFSAEMLRSVRDAADKAMDTLDANPINRLAMGLFEQVYVQHKGDPEGFMQKVYNLYNGDDHSMQELLAYHCDDIIADRGMFLDGRNLGEIRKAMAQTAGWSDNPLEPSNDLYGMMRDRYGD
ncbi:hypothetical protein [Sansalvadorimonas verongulae]|uniref:hypothetical protein n=1 Tax=Sansalvadorimonas verongulae TaxID=2172824 RepID=UPI0012BC126B|nr:hypothetical protein [Sansalvadorimonas verongulae]MTI14296.1 hypothetical protein [Sansalvadorimonas verongulae]